MKLKRKYYIVLGAIAFVVYFGGQIYSRSHAAEKLAEETIADAVSTVSVVHAQSADPNETITLPGNIEAWFQAPIYAQVSGYVRMWYKDYGAEVKKGDVLAEINTPTLSAQFAQAKAAAEAQHAKADLAELTAKRYVAMRDSNSVPLQTINVKEADARVAEAELNAAQQNVKNYEALIKFTTIVAPYDGVVISRGINVGDYVNKEGNLSGASNLFTVADMHKMRLFVSVPSSFGQFLKPGLTADVTVPQLPNRHFKADFLTVAKGFGTETRTAVTEFVIDNEDRALWPNSYATVRLSAHVDNNELMVPATALVFQENGTEVATVTSDNKVHYKPITVTKILDSVVNVSKGITPEDAIIDNPSAALLEGDTIRITTPAPGFKLASGAGEGASEASNHASGSGERE